MSRLTKTIELNGTRITVNELTVRQVKGLWKELMGVPKPDIAEPVQSIFTNQEFMSRNWGMCVEGLTLEEADDLTPSEMKLIYDAFMEVNTVFFDLARQVEGEDPMLVGLRLAIKTDLITRFAFLSNADTTAPGTTDTASS